MTRAAFVGLIAAAAFAGSAQVSAATATTCSTKGLHFSYKSGTATYGNKVASLRATGASCATARGIATVAAKKQLRTNHVPATINGFSVHVKSPCSGCTPVWRVTATKGSSKVTFRVVGG